jgi:predicted dehydrogenase
MPALLSVPGAAIAGFADAGSGRAAEAARKVTPTPQVFATAAELIASDDIQGVVVVTPPKAQEALVLHALALRKPVLCEKPLGLSSVTTEALATAARESKATACVGFEFRYDPGIRMLRKAYREGRIGPLEAIDVSWITAGGARSPARWGWRHDIGEAGGVITEFGVHVIDYLHWISGEALADFRAKASVRIRERTDAEGKMRRTTAPDVLELDGATMSGIRVNVFVSNAFTRAVGHRIVLSGRAGRVSFLHRPPFRLADSVVVLQTSDGSETLSDLFAEASHGGDGEPETRILAYAGLYRDFLGAARGETSADLPGFDAAAAARRVTHAIEVATGYAE